MSSTSTPNDSPNATPIQPMHNPSQAAHVVVPQAPLGNVANQAPGLGAKALLAKKMAKGNNPGGFVSPTDNMMTPVSQKLAAAKKKHFTKAKPIQLFAQKEEEVDDEALENGTSPKSTDVKMDTDDGNPF